jgi:ATP-binding cassette subfamily B protein
MICEIVQPELMSKIVDNGVSQKNLSYILHTGGIMIILSLIAMGADVGNIYFLRKLSQEALLQQKGRYFEL